MGNRMTSVVWLVGVVAFIKGIKARNVTSTRYTLTKECVFPSVEMSAITIATFFIRGMKCAAYCSADDQCVGYLLGPGIMLYWFVSFCFEG